MAGPVMRQARDLYGNKEGHHATPERDRRHASDRTQLAKQTACLGGSSASWTHPWS
jgi:hypothetical protein